MALQFSSSEMAKKFCPPKPTKCSGDFSRIMNFNETVTIWKSTEPAKGSFFLILHPQGMPGGAVAVFKIIQADGTTISRTVNRGTVHVLTVDNAVEATVQVQNGPPDQTALVEFMYCDLDLVKAKEGNCCPPPLVCDQFSGFIFDWEAQPFLTWESFFPVKGTLAFKFLASFDPAAHPSATIKVERFEKPDIVRNIPLNVSNTDRCEIPFVLAVDDIRKVTVTASEINPSNSSLSFILCHQEESAASCCDDPLKCEAGLIFFQPALPSQDIKIWESFIPIKGTFSITNGYDGTLTLNIAFDNKKTFERIIGSGETFTITAKEVKTITIRLNPLPTQSGSFILRYCIQDMPLQKTCKSSCCPTPLHCNLLIDSGINTLGEKIPLWISKIPTDGELFFEINGQPQYRTKITIKRFEKPDIVRTIEGEKIFVIRTTDWEGVFAELINGDPSDYSIRIVFCIQEQVCQNAKTVCCPEPVKCEFDDSFFGGIEYPLNKNIVIWESTEPVKGTFAIFNNTLDGVDMTVKIQYMNGCYGTQTLKSKEGFMITDKGIISVSVRFSSENPDARGDVLLETCTQSIEEQCQKDNCCPHPLICQSLFIDANNIRRNQKYLLWHSGFPVEAIMQFSVDDGVSATIIIERYEKSPITDTIHFDRSKVLAADHIKNVFVKVNPESRTGSVSMEVCMLEQLPLKGDENQCL